MPHFSVVMATNRIDSFFFEAVRSIQDQTYDDFEFIIVLNGAATAAIAALNQRLTDPRILICTSDFCYLNGALNVGVLRANGDYVVRMDADDIAHHDRLVALHRAICQAHQTPIVLYSSYDFVDGDGKKFENPKALAPITKLPRRNVIAHPTTAIRRDALLDLGGYLGSIYSEDYDLWARVLRHHGFDGFCAIPEKLLWYRIEATGAARRNRLAYFGMAAVQFREFLISPRPAWALGGIETIVKGICFGK